MNRLPFETGQVYHIYNRGTDKRNIFMDNADRQRFINAIYEFNDENPALNSYYKTQLYEVKPRKKMVEIIAYCLMPNHYHFMLRQISDAGITRFMQKLGTGYTMYFNQKHERSGSLFQGKFKSVVVDCDEYLRYLPHYIHLNPIEITTPDWQVHPINIMHVLSLVGAYKWSSYEYFTGTRTNTPLLTADFIKEIYAPEGYDASLKDWLKTLDVQRVNPILLD